MFEVNEMIVAPGHGVVKVQSVQTKSLNGVTQSFYILEVLNNKMKVMYPVNQANFRELSNPKEMEAVYSYLQTEVQVDFTTWNRRWSDYMTKVKTGSVMAIAEVYHQLQSKKTHQSLSFGERKMLDQCEELLITEFTIATKANEDDVREKLRSFYK